jgi:hypothetical protein
LRQRALEARRHRCERKEARWEEGAGEAESAASGSEEGMQRKAVGSAGSTIGASIVVACDEERSISWSGQQRGGVRNTATVRRKWARGVLLNGRPRLSTMVGVQEGHGH